MVCKPLLRPCQFLLRDRILLLIEPFNDAEGTLGCLLLDLLRRCRGEVQGFLGCLLVLDLLEQCATALCKELLRFCFRRFKGVRGQLLEVLRDEFVFRFQNGELGEAGVQSNVRGERVQRLRECAVHLVVQVLGHVLANRLHVLREFFHGHGRRLTGLRLRFVDHREVDHAESVGDDGIQTQTDYVRERNLTRGLDTLLRVDGDALDRIGDHLLGHRFDRGFVALWEVQGFTHVDCLLDLIATVYRVGFIFAMKTFRFY